MYTIYSFDCIYNSIGFQRERYSFYTIQCGLIDDDVENGDDGMVSVCLDAEESLSNATDYIICILLRIVGVCVSTRDSLASLHTHTL